MKVPAGIVEIARVRFGDQRCKGGKVADAIVIGGGPTGLAAGMVLAEHGVETTVLEKDAAPVPDSVTAAWESWERNGVSQFRGPHTILARGFRELDQFAPGVVRHLEGHGAHEWTGLEALPPSIDDRAPRPQDDRFKALAARRPIYELAFAAAANDFSGLEVRRGTTVTELLRGPSALGGVPHVAGVKTSEGDTIRSRVVIDAGGRRSNLSPLLETIGATPPNEVKEDSRFAYYTRFYHRFDDGDVPRPFVARLIPQGSISLLLLPGDNETWSVTLFGTTADRELRLARNPETFDRVIRAYPAGAHWAEGQPTTEVDVKVGISDRIRSLRVDGQPAATGIVPVGDAWACTNPSLGRGISMAMMHTRSTVPGIAENLNDPGMIFDLWESGTEEELVPWHEATRELDRERNRQMDAQRSGQLLPADELTDRQVIIAAQMTDPDVFRASLEMGFCLALPEEVMSRPYIQRVLANPPDPGDLPLPPVPSRQQLEELLGA